MPADIAGFQKGHPRYGGRRKGSRNRFGGDLREEVVAAIQETGFIIKDLKRQFAGDVGHAGRKHWQSSVVPLAYKTPLLSTTLYVDYAKHRQFRRETRRYLGFAQRIAYHPTLPSNSWQCLEREAMDLLFLLFEWSESKGVELDHASPSRWRNLLHRLLEHKEMGLT
jgi:hypothetical protein